MDTIFTLEDVPYGKLKINLDELYEKKQKNDLNTLSIYNSILNRIHTKIKYESRKNVNEQCCWYVIPEIIIGVPKYDNASCIAYIMNELKENGFILRYTHPNLLFISWKHWVPSYVRNELKNKTGIAVDGYGNQVIDSGKKRENKENPNNYLIELKNDEKKNVSINNKLNINYKPINSYKPIGIYNNSLFKNN